METGKHSSRIHTHLPYHTGVAPGRRPPTLTETPFNQKASIEGHNRRPHQKATEGHTRRPQQKVTPEGDNRRPHQKAITGVSTSGLRDMSVSGSRGCLASGQNNTRAS